MSAVQYKEEAHRFGTDKALLGIATVPAEREAKRPVFVLLNAGLVHRIGPFRLGVELARQLAQTGAMVFRVDQSALGDSFDRAAGDYEARVLLDGKETFDFLQQRYGAERFVVLGLCSGAMNAHRLALADTRVVGAVLLDGYAYKTPSYYRKRLLPRLLNPENWDRAIAHLRHRFAVITKTDRPVVHQSVEAPGADASAIFAQDWPPHRQIADELERIVRRGAKVLFLYTGGWSSFVDERQFAEMFPAVVRRGDAATVRYFPEADHTFVRLDDRARMIDAVVTWARRLATT